MPDEHVSSSRMPHSLYLYFSVTSLSPTHANYRLRQIAAHTADIHTPKHVHDAHIITETYFVLNSLFFLRRNHLLNIFFEGIDVLIYLYSLHLYLHRLQLSVGRTHPELSSTHAPNIFKTIFNTISFLLFKTLYCAVLLRLMNMCLDL